MSQDNRLYDEKPLDYFGTPHPIIETVLPKRFDSVLEIGCGAGGTMAWLKQQRPIARAVGIDLMPAAIDRAKHVFDQAFVANIEVSDLPAEKFDLIVALDVLEHLVDPWRMIQRLHGLLAPGGSMVVFLPHIAHWTVSLPLLTKGQWNYASEGLLDRTHLRFFSERGAMELMTSSGLVIEQIERERQYPRWMANLSPRFRWYFLRAFEAVFPNHLLVFRFLIRVGQTSG